MADGTSTTTTDLGGRGEDTRRVAAGETDMEANLAYEKEQYLLSVANWELQIAELQAKHKALIEPLVKFTESFLRNAPLLQVAIGGYSMALEGLQEQAGEALRQLGEPHVGA